MVPPFCLGGEPMDTLPAPVTATERYLAAMLGELRELRAEIRDMKARLAAATEPAAEPAAETAPGRKRRDPR